MSQLDYFFLYEHYCEVDDYGDMKYHQKLTPDYIEYLTMLIKLFNQTIQSPKTIFAVLRAAKKKVPWLEK